MLAAVFGVAIAHPQSARAQVMTISKTELRTYSPNGVGTLSGGQAMIWFPIIGRATQIRIGLSQVHDANQYMGTVCQGIIQPGTCPPELIEEKYTILAGTFGIGQQLVRTRPVQLQLFADAFFGDMTPILRSIETDETLTLNLRQKGWRVGAEAWWWPTERAPFGVSASISRDQVRPNNIEFRTDGWTPIRGNITATRLALGVVFGKRP